jgi:hypothetical protein
MKKDSTRAGGCEPVCSLPEDALRERLAMLRREILPLVTRREALANGVAFEFADSPALERQLEELVAFERQCCSGLGWSLQRPAAGVLRLCVEGLAPGAEGPWAPPRPPSSQA